MRHQRNRHKLSRDAAHRKALLLNVSKQLIEHERIETTISKAKAVKPEVEKLIKLARRGDLHARPQALPRPAAAPCPPPARPSPRSARTSSRYTSFSRRSHRATRSGPAATRASSSSARA